MKHGEHGFVLLAAGVVFLATQSLLLAENVDPQKAKADADGKSLWYDCKDIGVEGKGWSDSQSTYDRLPAKAEGKVSQKDWGLSHQSAGLCVRFSTDAAAIQVRWTLMNKGLAMPHMPATGVSGVDLYAKDKAGQWRFVQNGRPTAVTNTATFKPPAGEELLLYLPLYNGVKSVEIGIPTEKTISTPDAAAARQRKTVVIYGTSITQGGCASRPGMAFPAIMGRWLDATVINLGFSGSGLMEPELADLLAELDPSIYVLDTMGNMSEPQVSERTEPFVKKLRQAHPATPIVLVEDANLANKPTEKGRLLQDIREKLGAEGVKNLYFLSNQGMLGDDGEGTVDGGHPNDLGMMRHAEVFAKGLRPILHAASSPRTETIDPQKAAADADGKTDWYENIGVEGKGWNDTQSFYDRLPAKAEGKVPASVWTLSHQSAGLCVRFRTDAPMLQVRWSLLRKDLASPHMPATGVSGVDLYAMDKVGRYRFVQNGRPTAETNTASFKPPAGEELLLYLPLYNGVKSVAIGIPKGKTISTLNSAPKDRKTIVVYGTSITQGGCASRPGMAWPAIMGRKLNATVINLGFSGAGHMEPEMADLLAELNPTVYVLDCLWNMGPDDVTKRIEPFVKKLREAHPDTPIVLAEDSSVRNVGPTAKGRILRTIYEKLTTQGVKNLHFLSNEGMLGDDGEGTVDGVHPNDLGMMRQAEVFTKALRPLLREAR